MSFATLNITSSTNPLQWMQQIDDALLIKGNGNPNGLVAANRPNWFIDQTNELLYFCFVADGTTGGTIWTQVNFTVVPATTGVAGVMALATEEEVLAGTVTNKAVTPATGTAYAKTGENADITALLGMEVPLGVGSGGTGVASLTALILEIFPTLVSGQYLTTDGTNLIWSPLANGVLLVSSGLTLALNTFHFINANSLSLVLPTTTPGNLVSLGFASSVTTGPTISAPSGVPIFGSTGNPLSVDVLDPFTLIYTGNVNGWEVKR